MFLIILAQIVAVFATEPFWRAKEKVYERIQNREVIVSVKSLPRTSGPKHQLSISGGGQVSAPCPFVFEASKDYETFALESGYVDRAKFDSASQVMEARLSAYGYKSDIALKVESKNSALIYEIIKGPVKGMKGEFQFLETKSPAKCDVGLVGEYSYDKFPIPEIFLRFGMEFMLQRMAGRLRSYCENLYQKKSGSK
jgi:hypothetical protein